MRHSITLVGALFPRSHQADWYARTTPKSLQHDGSGIQNWLNSVA
jgi:hypothetical protein